MREKTYRIGEAADMLRLKSYVLRFWETEFPQLAPLRTDKGQRLYTDYHIALLHRIRQLLHEQGMTIEGARRVLASAARADVSLDTTPYMPAASATGPGSSSAPADYHAPTGGPQAGQPASQAVHSMNGAMGAAGGGHYAPPMPAPAQSQGGGTEQQASGQSIDRTVVREMRDELLALRNMLLADD